MIIPQTKVLPGLEALTIEAANQIVAAGSDAIERTGSFSIVLSGGSTPRPVYELLATPAVASTIDWTKVHVFFGDERSVPPDHPDSNYRMARDALLSHVPIPGDNIYRIRGEADPEQAAIEYGRLLKEKFGDGGADLVLLGMGEDGHTLSLFPNSNALQETKHRCVSNYIEKLTTWRITLTAPFVNRCESVVVLVAGAAKKQRIEEVLLGPQDPQRLPVQLIAPASGRMTWLMDAAAAGMDE